ncbi:hypothetical protein [Amycolatopsis saalfeldensis]|uniref:hypothetical protein n=1 Tax=Amycolatopsis saalfeldensis TaxID=394193 RepID=UPI001FE967CD|nr:hypothetical protein [Amycolatopsis saalfeldensis]
MPCKRVALQAAFGGAGFQPGDEGPQLVDCLDGPAGLAGDLGEADHGVAELHQRGEVGVIGFGDAEKV